MQIEIKDHSKEAIDLKNHAVQRAMMEIAQEAESNAVLEVTFAVYDTPESPSYRRTGNLRNGITHESTEDTAIVGTNTEYAPYVEMGTVKMNPRPFIKPAVENYMNEYKEILEDDLKKFMQ